MGLYRKKPVIVEAFEVGGDEDPPEWFQEALKDGRAEVWARGYEDNWFYLIKTPEGDMEAWPEKHWIIKGVEGELYPCEDRIFRKTYEKVEEESDATSEKE